MADLRETAPVDPNVDRPGSIRQSLLAQFDKCPHSGYLALKHGGGPPTHAQMRGTAFHSMAEIATIEMQQLDEKDYPPELARDLVVEVVKQNPELVVPVSEMESLRAMAWNWAKGTTIYHEELVGIERQAMLELNGWTLTGSMDLAYLEGDVGRIKDYKTGFMLPKQEEFERQFQGLFYALLLAEGSWAMCANCSVEVNNCECGETLIAPGEKIASTPLTAVAMHQIYPRHFDEETGKLAERFVLYDRTSIHEVRRETEAILERIEHGLETGRYPAVPGYHCGLCPAPNECPIPVQHRPVEVIETLEEAQEALSVADRIAGQVTRLKGSARAYAEANEIQSIPLAPDSDQEYAFILVKSEPVKNKKKLIETLESANVGDPKTFFSQRQSVKWAKRKTPSDEN